MQLLPIHASSLSLSSMSHLKYSTTNSLSDKTVAIGVYQEMRTFADNLVSWKRYIIEPLQNVGCQVHIYISMSRSNAQDYTRVQQALQTAKLSILVQEIDVYPFETKELHDDFLKYRYNNCTFEREQLQVLSEPEPLLRQYYARYRLGQMLYKGSRKHPYILYIYLRSDITFSIPHVVSNMHDFGYAKDSILLPVAKSILRYPNRTEYEIKAPLMWNTSTSPYVNLTLVDHLIGFNYSTRIAWIPAEENWENGLNDRILILTSSAFFDYASHFKSKLHNYFTVHDGCMHGESLHKFMLHKSSIQVNSIFICYGVRRAISSVGCEWSGYGEFACERMRLPYLSTSFNHAFLLPKREHWTHCIYGTPINIEPIIQEYFILGCITTYTSVALAFIVFHSWNPPNTRVSKITKKYIVISSILTVNAIFVFNFIHPTLNILAIGAPFPWYARTWTQTDKLSQLLTYLFEAIVLLLLSFYTLIYKRANTIFACICKNVVVYTLIVLTTVIGYWAYSLHLLLN